MPELRRLHAGHAPAVLAFELANRAYFAASVSDRGDGVFAQFTDRYEAFSRTMEADGAAGSQPRHGACTTSNSLPSGSRVQSCCNGRRHLRKRNWSALGVCGAGAIVRA